MEVERRRMMWAPGLLLLLLGSRVMSNMTGSISPVAVDDPEVLNATRAAVASFNRASNQAHLSKVRRVVSATKQVVSGLLYRLKLELGPTTCRKSARSNVNLDRCDFQQNPPYTERLMCTFEVWDQPWLRPMGVEMKKCRRIRGG